MNLFNRMTNAIKGAFKGFLKGIKNDNIEHPKPKIEEEIISPERQWVEYKAQEYEEKQRVKLARLKEKYQPLFELAQMKYEAISSMEMGDYSTAYINAGRDFSNTDITDLNEMFKEVARAQTFVTDPTSNIDVIKKYLEDIGVNIYIGRGNGDDDMKDFWKAVNEAKETSNVKGAIELKRYSGAFEYAYKVWHESDDKGHATVKKAIDKFLEDEYGIHAQDFVTDKALKYELPQDDKDLYLT